MPVAPYKTNIGKRIHKRILKRLRYVKGSGWIKSSDSYNYGVHPKFSKQMQRPYEEDHQDIFLTTIILRDSDKFVDSFVEPSYTFPTSGEALIEAQSGTDLVNGDRLIEEVSGKIWMVRSISEFRNPRLKHDELTCMEASQLDKRWIGPIQIKNMPDSTATNTYDPIRKQIIKLNEVELNVQEAFGVVQPFDVNRFLRDTSLLHRTPVGKDSNDYFQIVVDDQFNFNENSIFSIFGKNFKVEFIRRNFMMASVIGLSEYKQRGMGTDSFDKDVGRNIVL